MLDKIDGGISAFLGIIIMWSCGSVIGQIYSREPWVSVVLGLVGAWCWFDKGQIARLITKVFLIVGITVVLVARPDINGQEALRTPVTLALASLEAAIAIAWYFWPVRLVTKKSE